MPQPAGNGPLEPLLQQGQGLLQQNLAGLHHDEGGFGLYHPQARGRNGGTGSGQPLLPGRIGRGRHTDQNPGTALSEQKPIQAGLAGR